MIQTLVQLALDSSPAISIGLIGAGRRRGSICQSPLGIIITSRSSSGSNVGRSAGSLLIRADSARTIETTCRARARDRFKGNDPQISRRVCSSERRSDKSHSRFGNMEMPNAVIGLPKAAI